MTLAQQGIVKVLLSLVLEYQEIYVDQNNVYIYKILFEEKYVFTSFRDKIFQDF